MWAQTRAPESGAESLKDLLCCLPRAAVPDLSYENVFRVLIVQFMDAHALDVRSAKKTCIHFVHPVDGRLIPFDTYIECEGEAGAKAKGVMQVEGKDYVVADGDVVYFRTSA